VRALGRLERPAHAGRLIPFLSSPDAVLRKEAVNALGQMRAPVELAPWLGREKDPEVRGVIYATIGRIPQAREEVLLAGLNESEPACKIGAAKGLEAYYRLNAGTVRPSAAAVDLLRRTARGSRPAELTELALSILNAAGAADPETLAAALRHAEPQVRRLAVLGSKQWRQDNSHIVRYEALRFAGSCERLESALGDANPHVVLLAIDLMGNGCSGDTLERIVDNGGDWRQQAHALVSLASVRPASARARLDRLSRHPLWQARAYAAGAAKTLKDEGTLRRLLGDENPNVAAAALADPADAAEALKASHYGLIIRAAECLKGWPEGRSAVPALLESLGRITAEKRDTSRDPRRLLLERLREFGDAAVAGALEPYLSDFDPVIADLAARTISEKSGRRVVARTARLTTRPAPPQEYIDGLSGSRARIRMREAGVFTVALLPEEAPVTAATFARLAESGYYTGLTFHRIVPNFVIQGGSPGADEFDGSPHYIRDELGLLSHRRGTLGISTRGRDTGDCQIFVNLVDNFRLDHNYTVFANVLEGMENVDRLQEGDIIQSIEIIRRNRY
jgi:cyclophilin family peptidyl-prolyl cis-trans isomerase/HEAT repeat protein